MNFDPHSMLNDSSKNSGRQDHHQLEDKVDFREFVRIIKIHWQIVVIVALATMSGTGLYSFFLDKPIYRTATTLMIDDQGAIKSPLIGYTGNMMGTYSETKGKVLTEHFYSEEFALGLAKVFLSQGRENPAITPFSEEPKRILRTFGYRKDLEKLTEAKLIDIGVILRSSLSIRASEGTVHIDGRGRHPRISQLLANLATEYLVFENLQMLLKKGKDLHTFLGEQTRELEKKLISLESDLVRFQKEKKTISVAQAENSIYRVLDKDRADLKALSRTIFSNKRIIEKSEQELERVKNVIANPSTTSNNMYISQLQHRLSVLQYQLAYKQSQGQENDEEGKQLKSEIKQVTQSYRRALDNRNLVGELTAKNPLEYLKNLERDINKLRREQREQVSKYKILKESVFKLENEAAKLPDTLQKLTAIKREIEVTKDLYIVMKKRLQEAQIQEAGTNNDLNILSLAPRPSGSIRLKVWMRFVLAALVGFAVAATLVILFDFLIPTVRSRHDVERIGLVVLGQLPTFESEDGRRTKGKTLESKLIMERAPNSPDADNLRGIRMRLESLLHAQDLRGEEGSRAKTILISSTDPDDGKSFVAANVAISLAKADQKVLLIDMDMRNPSLYSFFALSSHQGCVGNHLSKGADYSKSMIEHRSEYLDILLGDTPVLNAAELLESHFLGEFLNHIKDEYDYIIMDSPPILATIDPILIGRNVDQVIIVVEHKKTFRDDLKQSIERLQEVYGGEVAVILNFVHREFTRYYAIDKDAA